MSRQETQAEVKGQDSGKEDATREASASGHRGHSAGHLEDRTAVSASPCRSLGRGNACAHCSEGRKSPWRGQQGRRWVPKRPPAKVKGKMWQWHESENWEDPVSMWAQLGRGHRDKYHRDTGPSR